MFNRNWFSLFNSHPIYCLVIIGVGYYFYQNIPPSLEVSESKVQVEDGFIYTRHKSDELEVYPFMIQKRFLGLPKKSGVTAAVYYVTKGDLEEARSEYSKKGGCWAATFSAFKRELLVVGDYSKIKRKMKDEGPPALYGDTKFVTVRGSRLNPIINSQEEEQAQQIANMRNSNFYYFQSVY
jgi:hypothetical protein